MAKYPELSYFYSKKIFKELKKRIFFVVLSLVIFRIGSFIPIPGINTSIIEKVFEKQKYTILGMFNMFSGGALSRSSVLALGIVPYISSSIIVQLLTIIYPNFSELKKEGEIGKQKINRYTRYGTLILSLLQSIGISTSLPNIPGMEGLVINPNLSFYFISVLSLVCGTMFLMWLGEQITEKGIGNGISIIIFSGIISGLPSAIGNTIERSRQGDLHIVSFLFLLLFMFVITYFVVFIERGQRRILVNYAYRQQGRKIFSTTQSTHLPLKINMSGVMPAIFSSSLILFPATISSWFGGSIGWDWMMKISFYLQPGKLLYIILYTISVIFFCFFYTSIVFNPKETAENLKRSGAFVPGIRPGEQTAKYIEKVMHHLTLFGSLYIVFICLIPEFMRHTMKAPFYFGGTSLLIVVVVIMDFIAQIQTLLMTSQYESTLKKSTFKKNVSK